MINFEDLDPVEVNLKEFAEKCGLELISGDENDTVTFDSVLINRPGLYLAGFKEYFGHFRIQLIGNAEHFYLESLSQEERKEKLENLFSLHIPCIIYSRGIIPSDIELELAKKYKVPILGSSATTTFLSNVVANYLEELLAPMKTIHGTLMDVAGVGVLITGKSGMGKSEAALELIQRGHRLISDDIVIAKRISDKVFGTAPEKTKYLMEIRGLGIIDVATMFGAGSVLDKEEIMLIVELKDNKNILDCDRFGSKIETQSILDVPVPKYSIPVIAGRNIAILIEVAVRNFRLKNMGQDATQTLMKRVGFEKDE